MINKNLKKCSECFDYLQLYSVRALFLEAIKDGQTPTHSHGSALLSQNLNFRSTKWKKE